jgi:SAM-dependent methyltransferase
MCHQSCIDFGVQQLSTGEVAGRQVLEVGSYDRNGSLRSAVESLGPASYIGVDLTMGPCVDEVCAAGALLERFGPNAFDVVICTELMEHMRDWQQGIHNLKGVLRPRGVLILTTRSKGFPYHGYPYDFWRFELDDMAAIFGDFEVVTLEDDPVMPGVLLKARKPDPWSERELSSYEIYSILSGKRAARVLSREILALKLGYAPWRLVKALVPRSALPAIKRTLTRIGDLGRFYPPDGPTRRP